MDPQEQLSPEEIQELKVLCAEFKRAFKGNDTVCDRLRAFCHAHTTTHVEGDPCGSAQLEGRRQVWLLIEGYLSASFDEEVDDISTTAMLDQEETERE